MKILFVFRCIVPDAHVYSSALNRLACSEAVIMTDLGFASIVGHDVVFELCGLLHSLEGYLT